MPMNAALLATEIDALMPRLPTEDARQARLRGLEAIATGIVEHIKANAQISGVATGLVAPSGGGPVTGTLSAPPGSID